MMVAALSNASRFVVFLKPLFLSISCANSRKKISCFGVEIMDNPAHYARELLSEFQACAKEDGVYLAPIELHHADFLVLPAVKQAMSSAGLVYINNPKFGPELNGKILSNNTP
jgi:hypothetical protein